MSWTLGQDGASSCADVLLVSQSNIILRPQDIGPGAVLALNWHKSQSEGLV